MFFLCSVLGMSGFEPHRAALLRLAEMTSSVLEDAFARVKASDGPGFFAATSVFADLGRGKGIAASLTGNRVAGASNRGVLMHLDRRQLVSGLPQ